MNKALKSELFTLAIAALIATGCILYACLRSLRLALTCLGVLVAVLLVTLAAMRLFGPAWNLVNVAVLPLVVGIGIDDLIHLLHGLNQEHGPGRYQRVLKRLGPPVLMTSVTTIIGFGSLVLADYQAIASMGVAAVIGITAALVVSICSLPLLARCLPKQPTSDSQ